MAGKVFDIQLIPEFYGILSDHTVSEWMDQVELVYKMCGVDNIERIIHGILYYRPTHSTTESQNWRPIEKCMIFRNFNRKFMSTTFENT